MYFINYIIPIYFMRQCVMCMYASLCIDIDGENGEDLSFSLSARRRFRLRCSPIS